MQILTLHASSKAFDFEKPLHTRETQLIICTASCALSHWGLVGSTALTQTCAARDSGFFSSLLLSQMATIELLQTAVTVAHNIWKKNRKFSLECLTSRTQTNGSIDCRLGSWGEGETPFPHGNTDHYQLHESWTTYKDGWWEVPKSETNAKTRQ